MTIKEPGTDVPLEERSITSAAIERYHDEQGGDLIFRAQQIVDGIGSPRLGFQTLSVDTICAAMMLAGAYVLRTLASQPSVTVTDEMVERALTATVSGRIKHVSTERGWSWEGSEYHSYDKVVAMKAAADMMIRLQAALKQPSVTGWQTIESAPKDGTRILLYTAPYGAGSGHWDGKWHSHFCLNRHHTPTKWQPLPAPPTQTEK